MKPHIKYWKHGLWECTGRSLTSFEKSPVKAYQRWLEFNKRMKVSH